MYDQTLYLYALFLRSAEVYDEGSRIEWRLGSLTAWLKKYKLALPTGYLLAFCCYHTTRLDQGGTFIVEKAVLQLPEPQAYRGWTLDRLI